jgi:hypothetical protein
MIKSEEDLLKEINLMCQDPEPEANPTNSDNNILKNLSTYENTMSRDQKSRPECVPSPIPEEDLELVDKSDVFRDVSQINFDYKLSQTGDSFWPGDMNS